MIYKQLFEQIYNLKFYANTKTKFQIMHAK